VVLKKSVNSKMSYGLIIDSSSNLCYTRLIYTTFTVIFLKYVMQCNAKYVKHL